MSVNNMIELLKALSVIIKKIHLGRELWPRGEKRTLELNKDELQVGRKETITAMNRHKTSWWGIWWCKWSGKRAASGKKYS